MRKWFSNKMKSEYMQSQLYFMSSVGLFYLIIIALFAVPLLAAFVVVIIKGVFDFRYIILSGALILMGLAIYFSARFLIRLIGKIKKDGVVALNQARDRARRGESVQLELLGGLFRLSCGQNNNREAISYGHQEPLLIEDLRGIPQSNIDDPIEMLKKLSVLKDKGIIDEDEFLILKKKLIRNFCDNGNQQ